MTRSRKLGEDYADDRALVVAMVLRGAFGYIGAGLDMRVAWCWWKLFDR